MRGSGVLTLACLILALLAVGAWAAEEQRTMYTSVKKQRSVDLRRGFRPRRSAKMPDRFSHGASTTLGNTDEYTVDMPAVFKNPNFVREHRGFGLRRRTLQSVPNKEQSFVAKAWPQQFTINFTTKGGSVTGFLAYDWTNQRQVVYHGPNSTFCQNAGTDEACLMLEVPSGTYVYIPSQSKCWLSVEGVGCVPPEWTVQSTFVGEEVVTGVGLCRKFAFPPTMHIWAETVDGGLPCLFVFPEPSMSYYFDPSSLKVGAPGEEVFEFPDYCFAQSGSVESE